VPQQDLRELLDEQRRHVDALAEQPDIGRLDRRGGGEPGRNRSQIA